MDTVFVNYAFSKAISNYINNQDKKDSVIYNSFLCLITRSLVSIYGEMDIVIPYENNNIDLLKLNLTKFGYTEKKLDEFFENMKKYEEIESENEINTIKKPNDYFVLIEKNLIDMFIKKRVNYEVSEEDINNFYNLLYTNDCKNPLMISYNYLTASDPKEIENYFKDSIKKYKKKKVKEEKKLLNIKAYELMGFTIKDIKKMTSIQIDELNKKVYEHFDIKNNAINREYLLEKAIEKIERENAVITSGNGYVDILIVLGIVVTSIMVVALLLV